MRTKKTCSGPRASHLVPIPSSGGGGAAPKPLAIEQAFAAAGAKGIVGEDWLTIAELAVRAGHSFSWTREQLGRLHAAGRILIGTRPGGRMDGRDCLTYKLRED